MEQVRKTLEKIWLNEKEIKIYLTSLSIGQSSASILGKKNNIARSTAQYTCQSLSEKWLLSVISSWNTFLYSPENPEKLLSLVNKEYDVVEKKFHSTKKIMWDLKAMMNPDVKLPSVKYFSWVEWLIELIEDIFKENHTIYGALELTENIHPDILKYVQTEYVEKRKKSWISARMIFNDNEQTRNYKKYDSDMGRVSLLVDEGQYPFDSCIHIYWKKVAFYSFNQWDMTWVLIENEYVKNMIFSIFKMAWNFSKSFPENKEYKDISI